MIYYYTNREISTKLKINLARWKRWSRCFLPPDPLGGMQSGYARQYVFKDIFIAYLGGHLLSHLKRSVPECLKILNDLSPWLKKNGFLELKSSINKEGAETVDRLGGYRIYFYPLTPAGMNNGSGFGYLIRKTISVENAGWLTGRISETVEEVIINTNDLDGQAFFQHPDVHLINLSALFLKLVADLQHRK